MTFDRDTGLEEYLRQQARKFHHLPDVVQQKLGPSPIPSDLAGIGEIGVPTVMIAAVDSSEEDKDRAHVTADGTNDELAWDQVAAMLPPVGGDVVVCEGGYSFAGTHQAPGVPINYRALGAAVIDITTAVAALESTGADNTILTQRFINLTFTGGVSSSKGIRRNMTGLSNPKTNTIYDGLLFKDFTGSACIGNGSSSIGLQGLEGSVKMIACTFDTVEILGGGSLNAGVVHDDSNGPPHTAWGCHFEDITHTQGGSACFRLESGTPGIVVGSIFENAGLLRSNTSVIMAHNMVDGLHVEGDHDVLTTTILGSIPQSDTFYRAGTVVVQSGVSHLTFPFPVTIVNIRASVDVAPTGSTIIVDVNKNGTSIYPTSPKPDIAIGATKGVVRVPDTTAVAVDDDLTVDIDQAGSTIAGEDLTVTVYWKADA